MQFIICPDCLLNIHIYFPSFETALGYYGNCWFFTLYMIWIVLKSTTSLDFSAFSLMKSGFVGFLYVVLFTVLMAVFVGWRLDLCLFCMCFPTLPHRTKYMGVWRNSTRYIVMVDSGGPSLYIILLFTWIFLLWYNLCVASSRVYCLLLLQAILLQTLFRFLPHLTWTSCWSRLKDFRIL